MDEEIINEEISKNGNTNFITNSGLKSGAQIFAIGDSHSIFFYNSLKIKEHWLGCTNLPISIYRIINEDIDLFNIGNFIMNGHEKYNIKENDYVILYYGFNDIQKNIHKYANNDWENETNLLIIKYIHFISKIKERCKIIPLISCIYPNPLVEENVNAYGTSDERRKYTLKANSVLKEECGKNNLLFLNIYNFISDNNGNIKKEFTKDNIHLDYNNIFLRNYIESTIYNLIENFS
jgi:hypothetical protein